MMKNLLLRIGDAASIPVHPVLSFAPLQKFINEKLATETGIKTNLYKVFIDFFDKHEELTKPISICDIGKYSSLLEMIFAGLTGIAPDDKKTLWAFGMPVPETVFYASDNFTRLIEDEFHLTTEAEQATIKKEREKEKLVFIYLLILERCYGFNFFGKDEVIYKLRNTASDYQMFYAINIDARFIEISLNGPLPPLDFEFIESNTSKENILEYLGDQVQLENFTFSGFSIVSFLDVTSQHALQNIKNVILDSNSTLHDEFLPKIITALQSIVSRKDIDFGFMPFIKLNKKIVLDQVNIPASILLNETTDSASLTAVLQKLSKTFAERPQPIIKRNLIGFDDIIALFVARLKKGGYRSFALVPLFNNKDLIGVLEVCAKQENLLSLHFLAALNPALPYIAQMLKSLVSDFQAEVSYVINEKFTSIQPSVQWKFEKAALTFLRKKSQGQKALIEPIVFKDVYPLYGAVDIRDSTIKRNAAAAEDFKELFHLLNITLNKLKETLDMPVIDEMLFNARRLEKSLGAVLTADTERGVSDFFCTHINTFMSQLSDTYPVVAPVIKKYVSHLDEAKGTIFTHRNLVENSITMINTAVSNYIDWMKDEVMNMYPCYFESFRTDGVEYDIYLGQSIAPDIPFSHLLLKNFRLLQLKSMAAIAKLTHALLPLMQVPLETTQLIFIHNDAIDISFRNDERRFDVEGGYNIRYHIVKKRIDKILLKDSAERLTQPRKIAMVYSDKHTADHYAAYISFLQEEHILEDEVEYLDLEEMQGVSGLKAIRVSVIVDR